MNDVILNEGEQGRELPLLRHGTVRVTGCAELEPGGAIHPGFSDLGAGELFGESALLPGARRTATVTAVTDCELAVIDRERLLAFLEAHPRTGYRFMLALYAQAAGRLSQTGRQLLRMLAWGLMAHRIEGHLETESEAQGRGVFHYWRVGWLTADGARNVRLGNSEFKYIINIYTFLVATWETRTFVQFLSRLAIANLYNRKLINELCNVIDFQVKSGMAAAAQLSRGENRFRYAAGQAG